MNGGKFFNDANILYTSHSVGCTEFNSNGRSHNEQFSMQTATALIIAKKSLLTHLNSLLCYTLDDCPEKKLPREGKKYATKKMALIPSR